MAATGPGGRADHLAGVDESNLFPRRRLGERCIQRAGSRVCPRQAGQEQRMQHSAERWGRNHESVRRRMERADLPGGRANRPDQPHRAFRDLRRIAERPVKSLMASIIHAAGAVPLKAAGIGQSVQTRSSHMRHK